MKRTCPCGEITLAWTRSYVTGEPVYYTTTMADGSVHAVEGCKPPGSVPPPPEPPPGSWASIARELARSGLMTGDEADRWKDEMKEREWEE